MTRHNFYLLFPFQLDVVCSWIVSFRFLWALTKWKGQRFFFVFWLENSSFFYFMILNSKLFAKKMFLLWSNSHEPHFFVEFEFVVDERSIARQLWSQLTVFSDTVIRLGNQNANWKSFKHFVLRRKRSRLWSDIYKFIHRWLELSRFSNAKTVGARKWHKIVNTGL